jgi:hypothetical protein
MGLIAAQVCPEAGQLLRVSSWYLCNPCPEAEGLQGLRLAGADQRAGPLDPGRRSQPLFDSGGGGDVLPVTGHGRVVTRLDQFGPSPMSTGPPPLADPKEVVGQCLVPFRCTAGSMLIPLSIRGPAH